MPHRPAPRRLSSREGDGVSSSRHPPPSDRADRRAAKSQLLQQISIVEWTTLTLSAGTLLQFQYYIRRFAESLIRSFAHSLIRSFAHSLIRPRISRTWWCGESLCDRERAHRKAIHPRKLRWNREEAKPTAGQLIERGEMLDDRNAGREQ